MSKSEQPTIPGALSREEKALEKECLKALETRDGISTLRSTLRDHKEEIIVMLKGLGQKDVTVNGHVFSRDKIERCLINKEKSEKKEAQKEEKSEKPEKAVKGVLGPVTSENRAAAL